MTENEAITIIRKDICNSEKCKDFCMYAVDKCAYSMAQSALKEVQKYRQIGTVEELARAKKYIDLAKKHGTIGKMIDECAEYESIGTAEECRKAVEKQEPKRPIDADEDYGFFICPVCRKTIYASDDFESHKFCLNCGQAIQWENLEEMEDDTSVENRE